MAKSARDKRGVTPEMEEKVFTRYGILPEYRYAYRIDHLIPPELGGADDVKNLWPQRVDALPYNARRKQLLTQWFLDQIAHGTITLREAQHEMADDWISAFVIHIGMVHLTPRTLSEAD